MLEINKVSVLGAGVLGTQIAFQTAYSGLPVVVYDVSDEALAKSEAHMTELAQLYKQDGVVGADDGRTDAAFTRLSFTTDLAGAASEADLVIEAVPELLDVKRRLYTDLAKAAPGHTIFATNSSTLLPSDLKEFTGRPDRFLAIHYANLIWKRNLVEIMGTADTDPAVVAAAVSFAETTGMIPIEIKKEQAGYILNSLGVPFLFAAGKLWASGVADPKTIDRAWKIGSLAPQGPFEALDIIGLTTTYNIASNSEDPGVREFAAALKEQYIDEGKLGTMTGEGFYKY
ncbi:3-hydroxyacyl-CoA dehydrogenase [Streptomyces sp. NPDC017991]|uniref:3-hydroxyacyl-CoA dehydrogenase n=1 Tax=Streptomyces sp. NPDC017991 TaxID=3365026 RepID=UPI0037ABA097